VLHAGGLLDYPLDSTGLSKYGERGPGTWVTVYGNKEHAFIVIANLRFDTSMNDDGDRTGPGWSVYRRDVKGFKSRHFSNYQLHHGI